MLDTTFGIITLIVVCADFLAMGVPCAWRRQGQRVEDCTVSPNHALHADLRSHAGHEHPGHIDERYRQRHAADLASFGLQRRSLLLLARAVTVLVGLHSRRMPGWGVLLAGGVGVLIGVRYYPKLDLLTPWTWTAPGGGQMFWAFALSLVISSVITAAFIVLCRAAPQFQEFDFELLDSSVSLIDSPAAADG
jgi:hypothetical protein